MANCTSLLQRTFQEVIPPYYCDKHVKDASTLQSKCLCVFHVRIFKHSQYIAVLIIEYSILSLRKTALLFSGPTPNSRDSSASITSPVGLTVYSHSYNKTTNCCHWWITVSCKMSCSHRGKISILKHQMTEELFSFLSITQLWWQAKSIIKENSELRHRLGWVCQTVYFGAKHNRISEEHNYSLFPQGLFIR